MIHRFDVYEVLENVWCVRHRRRGSCAYIVKTTPGALLVDAGPSASAGGILMGLQRARVGLASVRALLLTHWRSDRSSGAKFIKERSGTRVFYAPTAAPFMTGERSAGWWDRLRGRATPPPVNADRLVGDGDRIEGCLDVVGTSGYPDGHLAFYLPTNKVLFSGDEPVPDLDVDWLLPARGRATRLK